MISITTEDLDVNKEAIYQDLIKPGDEVWILGILYICAEKEVNNRIDITPAQYNSSRDIKNLPMKLMKPITRLSFVEKEYDIERGCGGCKLTYVGNSFDSITINV